MSLLSLLFGLRAVGVVDRVEGPFAVVEWPMDAHSDLPLALLPPGVREGDRLVVRLWPDGRSLIRLDSPDQRRSPAAIPTSRPRVGRKGRLNTHCPHQEVIPL